MGFPPPSMTLASLETEDSGNFESRSSEHIAVASKKKSTMVTDINIYYIQVCLLNL